MTDEKTETFRERLRKVREALGLTRAELAMLAQVSAVTIKSLEFGRARTSPASTLQVLSALARQDPKLARWIAAAADAPPQALEVLEPGAETLRMPPPIPGRILLDRRGKRQQLCIRLDWTTTAQLIQYVAAQDPQHPDGLVVTISIAETDPLSRV